MYKRKYIKPEIDISETIIKRSDGGDLTEAKEFVNDWNSKRSEQIHENLQSIGIPFLEDLYKKSLKRNVDTVELADINMPENALGAYHKILHKIDLETDDKDVKVHEVAHSSRPRAQEAKIKQLKAARKFLKDGVAPDDYLDSNNEIYARLMSLRKDLKLDPKKHYSISEIRKLIEDHSEYKIGIPSDNGDFRIVTTDSNSNVIHDMGPKENLNYNKAEIYSVTHDKHSILDRYTPMFIESLINDVADNRKYIPRASSGMSFDIVDWWNKLLQNNKSLEYQEFNEKVNSPKLYIPSVESYSADEDETSSTPTEDTEEVELAYARAHEGQSPTTAVGTEQPAKTPVQKPVGQHVYTNGVDYNGFSQKIKGFLDKVASHGISLRVTSGKRAKGSEFSHHENGDAVDFTPIEGQSWETLTNSFLDNTDLMNYVRQNGINLFDERQDTGSKDWTGAHWHVGLDSTQKGGWDKLRANRTVVAKNGRKIPYAQNGIADSRTFWQRLFNTHPYPTSGPVDLDELKRRQAWAESNNNPKAVSGAGAVGTYQIMPSVKKEYVKRTGHKGELTDPAYNEQVRDWYFNERIPEHYFVNAGNPTDSVRIAKQLAAYNAGPNSVMNKLVKAKKDGVDIYKTFDWLPYMPQETRDYVEFILRNKDTGGNRTNTVYKKYMK